MGIKHFLCEPKTYSLKLPPRVIQMLNYLFILHASKPRYQLNKFNFFNSGKCLELKFKSLNRTVESLIECFRKDEFTSEYCIIVYLPQRLDSAKTLYMCHSYDKWASCIRQVIRGFPPINDSKISLIIMP